LDLIPSARSLAVETAVSVATSVEPLEIHWVGNDRQPLRQAEVLELSATVLARRGGRLSRMLETGWLAVFQPDDASDALQAAIELQQELQSDRELDRAGILASIGVAAGDVYFIDEVGPFGGAAALARALSNAANVGAILADSESVGLANAASLRSRAGDALGWRRLDYLGDEQLLPLGVNRSYRYVELYWMGRPFGLRPSEVSHLARRLSLLPTPLAESWSAGTVQRWDDERGHGFISTGEGEFFYTDDRFVVGEGLVSGKRAWFQRRNPLVRGKNPLAVCVIFEGLEVDVEARRYLHGRQEFELRDRSGNVGLVPCGATCDEGTQRLVITAGSDGPVADDFD
jgi:cold shock CspA family protein